MIPGMKNGQPVWQGFGNLFGPSLPRPDMKPAYYYVLLINIFVYFFTLFFFLVSL